jgi:hypothetical protein
MECPICCEKYNKLTHTRIFCSCGYEACRDCIKKYLLSSGLEPQCMKCRVAWGTEFLYKNLPISFINGEYQNYQLQFYIDQERSKLPEAQNLLSTINDIKHRIEECENIQNEKKEQIHYDENKELFKQSSKIYICLDFPDFDSKYAGSESKPTTDIKFFTYPIHSCLGTCKTAEFNYHFIRLFYTEQSLQKDFNQNIKSLNINILSFSVIPPTTTNLKTILTETLDFTSYSSLNCEFLPLISMGNIVYHNCVIVYTLKMLRHPNDAFWSHISESTPLTITNHHIENKSVIIEETHTLTQLKRQLKNIYETQKIEDEIQHQKNYIKKCPQQDCRGFITSSYRCDICFTHICSKCFEVLGIFNSQFKKEDKHKNSASSFEELTSNHQCKEENIKSAELIKKETRPCPNCRVPIYRTEGCRQMWCVSCHTAFDWETLKIIQGHIHNPHFIEYMREHNNQQLRDPQDHPCGGLPNWYDLLSHIFFSKELLLIHQIYSGVVEITNRIEDLRAQLNTEETNFKLRVDYLNGEITEKQWTSIIKKQHKLRQKSFAVLNIYELYQVICIENFNVLEAQPDEIINVSNLDQIVQTFVINITEIKNYCNQHLLKISHNFDHKIIMIEDNFVVNQHHPYNTLEWSKRNLSSPIQPQPTDFPENVLKRIVYTNYTYTKYKDDLEETKYDDGYNTSIEKSQSYIVWDNKEHRYVCDCKKNHGKNYDSDENNKSDESNERDENNENSDNDDDHKKPTKSTKHIKIPTPIPLKVLKEEITNKNYVIIKYYDGENLIQELIKYRIPFRNTPFVICKKNNRYFKYGSIKPTFNDVIKCEKHCYDKYYIYKTYYNDNTFNEEYTYNDKNKFIRTNREDYTELQSYYQNKRLIEITKMSNGSTTQTTTYNGNIENIITQNPDNSKTEITYRQDKTITKTALPDDTTIEEIQFLNNKIYTNCITITNKFCVKTITKKHDGTTIEAIENHSSKQ